MRALKRSLCICYLFLYIRIYPNIICLNNIIHRAYLHVPTPLGKKKNYQYDREPSAVSYCYLLLLSLYIAHMCMCLHLSNIILLKKKIKKKSDNEERVEEMYAYVNFATPADFIFSCLLGCRRRRRAAAAAWVRAVHKVWLSN